MDNNRKSKRIVPKLKIITEGSYLKSNPLISSRTLNENNVAKKSLSHHKFRSEIYSDEHGPEGSVGTLTPKSAEFKNKPSPDIMSQEYVAYHQKKGEFRRQEVLEIMSPIRDMVRKISKKFGVLERPRNSEKFDHQLKIFHMINTYINPKQLASDYLNVHSSSKGLNIHIDTGIQPF